MTSLDMSKDTYGQLLVPLEINVSNKLFVVDTAGVYSGIFHRANDQLDLDRYRMDNGIEIYASNGSQIKFGTITNSLKIGISEVKDLYTLVLPDDYGNEAVVGSLGPDILTAIDVDFDFGGKKSNLFSSDHCEGKVVYWTKSYMTIPFNISGGSHITIITNLDGHDIKSAVDTGSTTTILDTNEAYLVFGLDTDTAGVETSGYESHLQYKCRFKNLSIQNVAVNNPLITLVPDAADDAFRNKRTSKVELDAIRGRSSLDEQTMTLGLNILRKLHVYPAYGEQQLYITGADAH
jgi:predicted aspartyl protease